MPYGKFVIPHPFGPLEQPRLGAYLARTWAADGVAEIKTPAYIRDNIHVGLLAACYKRFVEETGGGAGGAQAQSERLCREPRRVHRAHGEGDRQPD